MRQLSVALGVSGLVAGLGHAPAAVALEPSSSVKYRYDGGNEDGFSGAAVDPAGNVFIGAAASNNSSESVPNSYLMAKYAPDGQLLWERRHSTGAGTYFGQAMAVAADGIGNVYAVLSESYNYGRVLKYDADGNESVLNKGEGTPYNWSHGINLKTDANNQLYVIATEYVEKYGTDGTRQWRSKFSDTYAVPTQDVEIDANGNVYVLGHGNAASGQNIVLAKYSPSGQSLWTAAYAAGSGRPGGLELDAEGNPVILFTQTVNGRVDSFTLAKYSADGTLAQSKSTQVGYLSYTTHLAKSKDGDFVVGASFQTGSDDFVVARFDAALNLRWQRTFNFGWADFLNDITVDDNGGIALAATTQAGYYSSSADFRTIKLTATGETDWEIVEGRGVASWAKIGPQGSVYVGGVVRWPSDALVVRYNGNAAPVANAGGDLVLECQGATTAVTLDGSGSSAANGDALTFNWSSTLGDFAGPVFNTAVPLGSYSFVLTVSDNQGQSATDTALVEVKDSVPPSINAGGDVFLIAEGPQGATFQPSYTAQDVCGPVSVTLNPNSSVFPIGQHSLLLTATDAAGNQAHDSMALTVGYQFSGFLPPLNANGIYKLGRTLPVKFQLSYRDGSLVTNATPTLQLLPIGDNGVTGEPIDAQTNAQADTGFRYSDGQYVYNLSTTGLAAGTYRLQVMFGDGSAPRTIDVSFR